MTDKETITTTNTPRYIVMGLLLANKMYNMLHVSM